MKTVFKSAMIASVATLGLSLAACDGPAEEAAEDQGDAMVESVENQADAMEDAGTITDETADEMVDQAEDTADAMEEQGEATDEATDAM